MLTADFDNVILDFDTYTADSLKQKTSVKQRQGKDPIQYQITDVTNLKHIGRDTPYLKKRRKHTAICMVLGTLEIEPIWSALERDKVAPAMQVPDFEFPML